jgi:hypothetical protein
MGNRPASSSLLRPWQKTKKTVHKDQWPFILATSKLQNTSSIFGKPLNSRTGHVWHNAASVLIEKMNALGCPLWVKSGLMQCSNACPLYPQ